MVFCTPGREEATALEPTWPLSLDELLGTGAILELVPWRVWDKLTLDLFIHS